MSDAGRDMDKRMVIRVSGLKQSYARSVLRKTVRNYASS
jgi:hypothetical protein